MIKSTSFIVLTQFFHFNELKILRQPGYLIFEVKPTIFFYSVYFPWLSEISMKSYKEINNHVEDATEYSIWE